MPQDALAANVTLEQGKTLADGKGDVFRGLGDCFRPPPLALGHRQAQAGTCAFRLSALAKRYNTRFSLVPPLELLSL